MIYGGSMSYDLLYVIAGYFIGALPIGVLLSKTKGTDPRKIGSGNIGATNVMRAAGKMLGMFTLIGDTAKGFIPTMAAAKYGLPDNIIAAIGLTAFLGHLFPIYLKFKGGKGVATALGVLLAINPWAIIGGFIIFLFVILKWRYVSLGSISGSAAMPFLFYFSHTEDVYIYLSILISGFIIIRHRSNIERLLKGTEDRLNLFSK